MINLRLGRYTLGVGATVAMLAGCGGASAGNGVVPTNGAPDHLPGQRTFHYTGARQSFKVPAGVRWIKVVVRGASGEGEYSADAGGNGGRDTAVIPVRPGEMLYVFGGGEGDYNDDMGGFNGLALGGLYLSCYRSGRKCYAYGGGAASDVRELGEALDDRIVVAGGEGGAGTDGVAGGAGGGRIGGDGGSGHGCYQGGGAGEGGTQNHGGAGGGGYYGGGSSYVESSATHVHIWQNWYDAIGNGLVVLSW